MPSGATFKLNPQPVGNGFIWDGDKFHLTYAGHIELARVLAVAAHLEEPSLEGDGGAALWACRERGHTAAAAAAAF